MSIESLRRVLKRVKETARGMRKEQLQSRLSPKATPEAKDDEEKLLEGSDAEEATESAEEEAAEGDDVEKKPKAKKEDPAIAEIRKLLARS